MDENLLEEWCAFISDQSFDLNNSSDPVSEHRPSADCVKIENGQDSDDDDIDSIPKSIAERRAEKFGVFDVSRISTTSRFRTKKTSPRLVSPDGCSPCIVIPPGISAAELLDSPIMLSNSQISPTTGTFQSPPYNCNRSMINPAWPTTNRYMVGIDGFSSRLMLQENPDPLPGFPESENQVSSPSEHAQSLGADDDYQTLDLEQLTFDFENPSGFLTEAPKVQSADSHSDAKLSQISQSHKQLLPKNENVAERDQKGTYPSMGTLRTSDDGYNWRKYGQKQVKGSEYPRSYYKCTHSNCLVKKKVERSHDGQITEIIYKGSHTHPQSQPTRRSIYSCNDMPEIGENSESFVKVEGGSQRTSPTSVVVTELPGSLSSRRGKSKREFLSDENPELSYTFATHDEDELSHELMGVDDDESELKRRKKDNNCLIETSMASRAAREPRVVVSVESDVDILEDGYRWRKYGQKVVKGNPNPRSYYKCTSAGCLVRKHVERASHDLKRVITAYEGKHDHEVPAARNSNHNQMTTHPGNLPPSTQSPLTLPRPTTNMPKTERQVEDTAPHFEMKPGFNNQFLRPPFVGSDHQFGPTSFYQMKLPPLQNPMPYCSSFGMNPNIGIHQNRFSAPGLPHLPISVPLNVPRPGNLDFVNHGKYISPVPSFHQPSENDMRFVRPKQELKDDNPYDAQLPTVDCASGSSSSSSTSTHRQMMGSFLY